MHAFYSPKEEDFEAVKEGLKFAKIIEGEDGSFRAGYTLRVPGYKSERFLWMDEFFLCLRGKLRIAVSHPPSYQEKVFELNPGDEFEGPAAIEDKASTVIIPPRANGWIDKQLNIVFSG